MGKVIRPKYPVELSIGVLLLIFGIAFFLSHQIFDTHNLPDGENVYFGTFLVSCAVIIMVLVLWEELLFPIKIKPSAEGMVFRNHRTKLKKQLLIYCIIPVIFVFIYFEYEVNEIRFFVWAAVCIILPLAGKLISGINNYNDFLKLNKDSIEYKNNEKVGNFELKQIQKITLVRDERTVLHKIQLLLLNNEQVIIDIDEMELEAYFLAIDKFITVQYASLVKA